MEYLSSNFNGEGSGLRMTNVNIYNRKLQLVHTENLAYSRDQLKPNLNRILKDCSLLFNLRDTAYYLSNH